MIPKTLFLTKIIHRMGTQNLRDKNSLREKVSKFLSASGI
jgi:hypothetical protein